MRNFIYLSEEAFISLYKSRDLGLTFIGIWQPQAGLNNDTCTQQSDTKKNDRKDTKFTGNSGENMVKKNFEPISAA